MHRRRRRRRNYSNLVIKDRKRRVFWGIDNQNIHVDVESVYID